MNKTMTSANADLHYRTRYHVPVLNHDGALMPTCFWLSGTLDAGMDLVSLPLVLDISISNQQLLVSQLLVSSLAPTPAPAASTRQARPWWTGETAAVIGHRFHLTLCMAPRPMDGHGPCSSSSPGDDGWWWVVGSAPDLLRALPPSLQTGTGRSSHLRSVLLAVHVCMSVCTRKQTAGHSSAPSACISCNLSRPSLASSGSVAQVQTSTPVAEAQ